MRSIPQTSILPSWLKAWAGTPKVLSRIPAILDPPSGGLLPLWNVGAGVAGYRDATDLGANREPLEYCSRAVVLVMALTPLAAQQPAGNIESGKRDFVTFACSACHGYSGHGGVEVGAPRIATTALSYTAFAKYVRQPMRSMPRYATEAQLPEVALTDIYAFLKSIPAPPDSKSILLLQNN
jgi:mono/diheme cytochrome c family protein